MSKIQQTVSYDFIPAGTQIPGLTQIADWFHRGDRMWYHIFGYLILFSFTLAIFTDYMCDKCKSVDCIVEGEEKKKKIESCHFMYYVIPSRIIGFFVTYTIFTWTFGVRWF